ncbi:hypothetical protein RHODGE_RHODGE_02034 [Rhodoplanes serenus]|uniref:C4-dicarboxylate ABC transporter substrate-binding protein n=1 Tax=Rhodoplanes serenus TaxID=200615 RepID=A0A447CSN6_9BRAD|nr:tripartite tricarboxylate transporter substrate-binding protein [Rhodoplanes serenus]VCU08175.1 hypothetical protein RHODGE_RHODGE_02034 [Rhodoplanes serenus]
MHRHQILLSTAVAVLAWLAPAQSQAWEPKGQVECMAPSGPGSGLDTICRMTVSALQKTGLYREPIYVTNVPGGSGAVGIASVIAKRKGDPNLIVATANSLTFTMAMGRTPHTFNDVIPLAQTVAEIGGFFVRDDSKYKTLADMVTAMKANPKGVTFAGGSAPGGLDHIKVAKFAKAIGVDPTKVPYVPFQGGAEAVSAVLGGHVQVAAIDTSEAAGQVEAGKMRGLAIMAQQRSSRLKDIPTTYEQGVDVSYLVWRGFYMAPGAPPEAVKWWSDTIRKMVETPEYAAALEKLGWESVNRFGDDFVQFLNDDLRQSRDLLRELGFVK